ncbi:hypothetical protein [Marinobacter nauticus]|uniref:hypothetical protein n=1 Tax=Marinobacter nauticus TaxID=2743 RepID=UPI0006748949|nr:hypothetical protein [Marinobacter nauticus]
MKLKLMSLVTIFLIASCSNAEAPLTINEAESIGFKKKQQQLFQMIGAIDGWSGTWEGERVELYQFESPEKIKKDLFSTSTDEGNISGWVDKCTVRNMFMLSKGKKACSKLKTLTSS